MSLTSPRRRHRLQFRLFALAALSPAVLALLAVSPVSSSAARVASPTEVSQGSERQVASVSALTVTEDGTPRGYGYGIATMSKDGQVIAFGAQRALLPGAQNGQTTTLYARDRRINRTTVVSATTDGRVGRGQSFYPIISPDGTRVAFASAADNLSPTGKDPLKYVFIKDLRTGVLTAIPGPVGNGMFAGQPGELYAQAWSADGGTILLSGGYTKGFNLYRAVWVYDVPSGTFKQLTDLHPRSASTTDISADGQTITYVGYRAQTYEWTAYLVDRSTGTTRILKHPDALPQTALQGSVYLSRDGKVAVSSWFDNSTGRSRGYAVLYDTSDGHILQILTDASTGLKGLGGAPLIDRTGRHLILTVARDGRYDNDVLWDLYDYDRVTGARHRITQTPRGVGANRISYAMVATADFSSVVYLSQANNLVPGERPLSPDDNNLMNDDFFVADLRP